MPEPKPIIGNPIFVDSESMFTVYVNNTEVGFTPWDIRFKFREIMDSQGDQPIIKKHGTAVMAPAHAKVLAAALQQTISMYEEKFGNIETAKIMEVVNPTPTPSQ
jgi:hypothetical protein